jgi:hypothetical protein
MATPHFRSTQTFVAGDRDGRTRPVLEAPTGVRAAAAWRTPLLLCGIASALVFSGMVWLIRYDGYDPFSQVPSELTAVLVAFGVGVWASAGPTRSVRIVGASILGQASLALLWPFAPMHQRDVLAAGGGTAGDTLHLVLAGITVALMFLAIGAGAAAFGRRFRLYSVASIVVFLVFGGLTFLEASRLQANLPTPWIGLWERVNITTFQVWIAAFAARLLRGEASPAGADRPPPA